MKSPISKQLLGAVQHGSGGRHHNLFDSDVPILFKSIMRYLYMERSAVGDIQCTVALILLNTILPGFPYLPTQLGYILSHYTVTH